MALGVVLVGGAGLLVRWVPAWADPAQVTLGGLGVYVPAAMLLLRRR
ncbi:hypothetical protein ACFXPI_05050 [Streptomyces sp. NPDC059104]